MQDRLEERRGQRGQRSHFHARAHVREVMARITIEPGSGGRCVALVDVDICLAGGQRVRGRRDDILRIEFDPNAALSVKAAAVSAVRRHIRSALADGSAADWSAFRALGRFGASWQPDQGEEVQISVDASEPAVEKAA